MSDIESITIKTPGATFYGKIKLRAEGTGKDTVLKADWEVTVLPDSRPGGKEDRPGVYLSGTKPTIAEAAQRIVEIPKEYHEDRRKKRLSNPVG